MYNFAHTITNVHAHDAREWLLILVLLAAAVSAVTIVTVKYASKHKNGHRAVQDTSEKHET